MERIVIAMQDGGAGAGARDEAAVRAARPTSFCLAAAPPPARGGRGGGTSREGQPHFVLPPNLPPVGGTFHFENLIMPPLTKTCPKMVLSHKGGCLCVKDVFAKKFSGAGKDSAGGSLASVLRKHSSEGRTPDAVERCVSH